MLVLGGTHANEPAGHMAGIVLEENAKVEQRTIYVIPSINNSALTHRELGDFTETYALLMETGNPVQGRHLTDISAYINAFNNQTDKQIIVSGIPTYDEMVNGNLGDYLM